MSLDALAQGRQSHGDDVQTEVEVLTEPTLADLERKVAVGGRNHPDVNPYRRHAANPLELAFLQDTQDLGLRLETHVADLVEQNRAAVGELELPYLALVRASERAPLVAEQLTFQQRLRDRHTVELHGGPIGPLALGVNGFGHELLAGAAFTQHQHGGIRPHDFVEGLEDLSHGRRLADQVAEPSHPTRLTAKPGALSCQVTPL